MLYGPDDHWMTPKRLADLKRAYEIGMRETPAEVRLQAGYEVDQFLSGILPALLQVCIVQAAGTALGAVVGAIIGGVFGEGVGAIPGASYGAGVGFSLSATLLAWMGLAFLFVAVGKGLIDMVVLVQQAVVRAWKAADHQSDQRSWEVQQAGRDLARAMGMLMLLVLQAVVAWVLKKGIDRKAELLAELRKSKLGEGFAKWVDENLDRMMSDPHLRGHRGEGSSAKAPGGPQAQSPSQLAKRPKEDEAPPIKKPLDEHKVPCFNPYDKPKFQQMSPADQKAYLKELSDQLKRQQDAVNSLTADQYKAAREAYQAMGRNPAAEAAQAAARDKFESKVQQSIGESLLDRGMSPAKAKVEAAKQTQAVMSKLAALHEPDMIAGGWAQPDPKGMGRSDVNSSIGASWNQKERIAGMDASAENAIKTGRGREQMNVKLEPCRGRGVK